MELIDLSFYQEVQRKKTGSLVKREREEVKERLVARSTAVAAAVAAVACP